MKMSKAERLLHLLNLLRSRKSMNAPMLAKECEVTQRTIYRDIVALTKMEFPIHYDRGYKLASTNFLPPMNFSFDEYNLIKLALDSSPLGRTEKYHKLLKSVSGKIDNSLTPQAKENKKYAVDATHIEIPQHHAKDDLSPFFGLLEDAISHSQQLKVKYNSLNTGLTERIIEPYFIIFRKRAFYFVGFCYSRNEFRTFRLNRIKSIEPTGKLFNRNPKIKAEDFFDQSWAIYTGEPVEVEVIFKGTAAKVVTTSNHHKNEKIKSIDKNSVRYIVTTRGIEEIQRWIIGFGDEAEVIKPKELKDNLKRIGSYFTKKYK